MHTKRIIFWAAFLVVLALVVWGLAIAINRPVSVNGTLVGSPAPISESDHVKGSANAAVTLIEYSDFQCPACGVMYWSVARLLQDESSTTLRFVYRHFPLPQHANAIPSATAAEAAGLQGKFWEMYDLIFKNHTDWTELTDATPTFIGYAKTLGLDIVKFTADLKDQKIADRIQASIESGQVTGIAATPSFFLNGKIITNPQTYAEFKKLIEEAAQANTH